jgi:hypothetical protein
MMSWEIKRLAEALKDGQILVRPYEPDYDETVFGDIDRIEDEQVTPPPPDVYQCLEPKFIAGKSLPESAQERQLLYFIDGSFKTRVSEYREGEKITLFVLAAMAVACVRISGTKVGLENFERRLYLIFPNRADALLSDTTYDRLESVKHELEQQNSEYRVEFLEKKKPPDLRSSLLGKVRSVLHDFEHEMGQAMVGKAQAGWLTLDGAITKSQFLQLKNTIGLAKSFSSKPLLQIPGREPMMCPFYLTMLKEGHRSPIFKKPGTQDDVLWYIRLHRIGPPSVGGVVKVETGISNIQSEVAINSELVDKISAEIFTLRYPTTYPDRRWSSTIYPIHAAEKFMESAFWSRMYLSRLEKKLSDAIAGGR